MSKINVNILTSKNINCGIADTTEQLIKELEKCGNIEINVVPIGNTDTKNPWYFIKLLSGIEDDQITHIQYQPDLFGQLPLPILEVNFLPLVITLLKQRKNKIVTTLHEVGLNSRINRLILKFLNSSDRLIVHNRNMIEILKKNGINENKIVEIPLGSSEPLILDKNECKSKLEVSGMKVITIFGFVSPNKGHDLVIEILPELDKDTILFVAGGARNEDQEKYKKSLESKVLSLGLEDRVKFFNFVDKNDLPVIASATDLFVYPYKWIVASAALSLGLSYRVPTISSDLSYFKEIQDKYDCIELFKTGNKQDLLIKIRQLLVDLDRQAYLKKKCEEFYYDTSWRSVAKKTNAIYSELDMD